MKQSDIFSCQAMHSSSFQLQIVSQTRCKLSLMMSPCCWGSSDQTWMVRPTWTSVWRSGAAMTRGKQKKARTRWILLLTLHQRPSEAAAAFSLDPVGTKWCFLKHWFYWCIFLSVLPLHWPNLPSRIKYSNMPVLGSKSSALDFWCTFFVHWRSSKYILIKYNDAWSDDW